MSEDDIRNMARGMKHLYDESLEKNEATTPLYSEISEVTDQYSDREEIARGGMKTIYRVLDKKTDRYIAMAELHENAPEESYENFIREARLTANLEHPNIISIHDIGLKKNSRPYFTMDLKVGDSLKVILKKLNEMDSEYEKQYSLNTRLEIFSKICDAMDYAHSRGVLHLDLKPENIQIGTHGEVLVCDWGLGKVIDEPEMKTDTVSTRLNPDLLNDMTRTGEIKGTPGYMAPEQTIPNAKKTFQTDIYALGCLLYSMLTYKTTVSGSLDEMLDATRKGLIHLPSKVVPEFFLSKTLDNIFTKATALSPNERYESVKDLKSDISNFLAGYSTSVDKGIFLHELGLFYRRNKTACWTAMTMILVLFIVTTVFIFNLNRRIKEADTANKIATHLSNKQIEEHDSFKKKIGKISGKFLQRIKEQFNLAYVDKPRETLNASISSLNDILAFGDNSEEAQLLKLEMLFIKQDFNSFYALCRTDHPLREKALEFGRLKQVELLSGDEFSKLLMEINEPLLCEKMLIYFSSVSEEDSSSAVMTYLKILNPESNMKKFSFDPASETLNVHCPRFSKLYCDAEGSLKFIPVKHLNIKKLNLTGSGIKNLKIDGIQIVYDK